MPNLTSQMEAVCRRFEELSVRLNQPETAADPAQFRRLMQEYHEAEPVVDAYRALATAQRSSGTGESPAGRGGTPRCGL